MSDKKKKSKFSRALTATRPYAEGAGKGLFLMVLGWLTWKFNEYSEKANVEKEVTRNENKVSKINADQTLSTLKSKITNKLDLSGSINNTLSRFLDALEVSESEVRLNALLRSIKPNETVQYHHTRIIED